jgi:HlyD family secretion protein
MKSRTRGAIIALIVVVAAAGGAWWYFGADGRAATSAAQTETDAERVVATEASEGTVRVVVEGPASVLPVRTQTIRAGIGGVLTAAPQVGDSFAAGEVMVAFDTGELLQSIRQAELNLTQASLNEERAGRTLEQARADLQSTERLEQSGAATRDQVVQAATAVEAAEFALRAADLAISQSELSLESARLNLEKATVRAPFAGVVLESAIGEGDLVGSGSTLLVLADLARVRIDAEIDEYDIGKVEPGMNVTVTGDALGDESRQSRIDRISPAAEVVNNIPIFTVTAIVDNADGALRPGMNTDLEIMISTDRGIVVPSKAVSTVRDRSYVDVVADGVVETRRVTIGADDGSNVAVLEGLEAGELVVLPESATLTLTSGAAPAAGTSIIPINVPGSGGSR